MLKFSSSLSRSLCSWILIFCTKQKKNTVPYVENWENPLTVKDCCERAFEKKGIWHHLQQYSRSPFSYRSPYFISGIFILKLISITDRGMTHKMTMCWAISVTSALEDLLKFSALHSCCLTKLSSHTQLFLWAS